MTCSTFLLPEPWSGPPPSVPAQPSHGDEVHHQHERRQWDAVTEPADHHQPIPDQRPAEPEHGRSHQPHLAVTAGQQVGHAVALELHQRGRAGRGQQGEPRFNP